MTEEILQALQSCAITNSIFANACLVLSLTASKTRFEQHTPTWGALPWVPEPCLALSSPAGRSAFSRPRHLTKACRERTSGTQGRGAYVWSVRVLLFIVFTGYKSFVITGKTGNSLHSDSGSVPFPLRSSKSLSNTKCSSV